MDHGRADTSASGGRRLVAALVALGVFGAAGAFAWRVFAPVREAHPVRVDPPVPQAAPWASYPEGWTELPPPPVAREGAAFLWTGTSLLLWGGYDMSAEAMSTEGYSFDPSTKGWEVLPTAPAAAANARPVWTGDEAIFWGGNASELGSSDGVAYAPTEGTWRLLPPAPLDLAAGGVSVWTGTELVAWGGGDRGTVNTSGAAYDPSTDTWRRIAEAPFALNLGAASGAAPRWSCSVPG